MDSIIGNILETVVGNLQRNIHTQVGARALAPSQAQLRSKIARRQSRLIRFAAEQTISSFGFIGRIGLETQSKFVP